LRSGGKYFYKDAGLVNISGWEIEPGNSIVIACISQDVDKGILLYHTLKFGIGFGIGEIKYGDPTGIRNSGPEYLGADGRQIMRHICMKQGVNS
jgi:hypothetical protein